MAYCTNCGNRIEEGSLYCSRCGSRVFGSQDQQNYAPTLDHLFERTVVSRKNAIIAFVLAIVGLEASACAIFPYACFIFYPACLVLSIISIKKANQFRAEGGSSSFATLGRIAAIATIVVSSLCFILGVIMTFSADMALAFFEELFEEYGIDGGYNGSSF